jgi:hypothetical protein
MKKILVALVFLFGSLTLFAQVPGVFTFDGEMKTGFLWEKNEEFNQDPKTTVSVHNNDDAGDGQGRMRINFSYINGNAGIKGRIQWDNWQHERAGPEWPYLFGFINSFEDQFTISMGKLGASPWGTGGPEKWKELEAMGSNGPGGVRFEFKPNFLSGLNVGFVLNWYNGSMDRGWGRDVTLLDILQESVFGISYVNDYFLVRFAYRLDSEIDQRPGSFASGREGDDLIYRVEERIIENYLPGFQIWALGVYEGVFADFEECVLFENWLFVQYAPEWFTAQVRLGYDVIANRSVLHVKPSYYHNLFDKFISIGASFYYANDFGEFRINKDAPYTEIQIEPQIRFNFTNAYVAFVYNFKQKYKQPQPDNPKPLERFQTMNLRFGMWF